MGTFPAALSRLDWPLFPNLYRTPFAERYPQFGLVVPHFGLLASEARRKRVGSVSEARRKRVETASEPSRNRVGINRVETESGRCWPQNGPPYMLIIGGLCYVGIWWCSRGSGTGSLMECPIRFLRPPKHLQLLMGRLCCGHYLPRVLFDTAPCTSSV